ncbi:MAG: isopenicillin N synthase family oxygenase [Mycobacteriaceae bacterium]|nr:isopenicillin N synthase family oxygenase [Mycobacteriaceae bacterium]
MTDHILDVDLRAFEQGSATQRNAVVDGVMRSLATGFVYTGHDAPAGLLDEAYGMLEEFFALPTDRKSRWHAPGTHGQTGYTGLLVETAAAADVADWKEMLNWGAPVPAGHPLRTRYPHRYCDPVLPEDDVPGIAAVLGDLHRHTAQLLRRFLRVIAVGLGAHESLFDSATADAPDLTRALHYPSMSLAPGRNHVWAAEHADINLITALPRATAKGLEVLTADGWVDAAPPDGHAVINTGIMLDRVSNGVIPAGIHRVVADPDQSGGRISVVQFCHPAPWTSLAPLPACVTPDNPQRHLPVDAGALLDKVLWDINLVS